MVDLKRSIIGLGLGLVVNLACSDDGVPATSETDTGADTATATASGTATQGTDGASTASDTSDPSGVTADVTSGTSGSDSAAPTDSGGTSGSQETEGTSGTGTGTGTATDSDTDGTGTTGGMPTYCEVDEDCVVVNDCCSCTAVHMDDEPPECDIPECFAPICDTTALEEVDAVCVFGTCQLEETTCEQSLVACDEPPPNCEDGFLPSVDGDCWSGGCVPVEACDYVPDCTYCDDDETCVERVTQLGPFYSCEPVAPDCAGVPACDCMPDVCGGDPFECVDGGDPGEELSCICPTCG